MATPNKIWIAKLYDTDDAEAIFFLADSEEHARHIAAEFCRNNDEDAAQEGNDTDAVSVWGWNNGPEWRYDIYEEGNPEGCYVDDRYRLTEEGEYIIADPVERFFATTGRAS